MKRKMKYALLCMGMMLFSMQGMAQSEGSAGPEPKKEHFREIPNPEKTARKGAEHLKKELDLTEKQYKKVYKLLLKEQRELFEKRFQRPEMPGGMPGRGPRPHDGGMPPMGGPRPEGEGMRGMPMGAGPKEKQEDLQKRIEKKNKKMKKILTEAQYDQWLGMKQKPLPEPPKPEEVPSEEK